MSQTPQKQATNLLWMMAHALATAGAVQGARSLGDRGTYLGMSDIGRGMECLRSAVAGKVNHSFAPRESELNAIKGNQKMVARLIKRELPLHRGHWTEHGITGALLAAKYPLFSQLEIHAQYKHVPIQAHLDLTLVWGGKTPSVRVLEIKNPKRIVSHLYPSHETQLYAQLGLLKRVWSLHCFNLKDANGVLLYHDLTFPELVHKVHGIKLPADPNEVDIKGWVISISPDQMKAYGPYAPVPSTLNACLHVAEDIWDAVSRIRAGEMSLHDVPYKEDFYPLCDWCTHNAECPKFRGVLHPEYDELIYRKMDLKRQLEAIKSLQEEVDEQIRAAYELHKPHLVKGEEWILTGNHRFKTTTASDGTVRLYAGPVNPEPDAVSKSRMLPVLGVEPDPQVEGKAA